ncbi:unnamed protein product [Gordionus sp. m RMFG-2023]
MGRLCWTITPVGSGLLWEGMDVTCMVVDCTVAALSPPTLGSLLRGTLSCGQSLLTCPSTPQPKHCNLVSHRGAGNTRVSVLQALGWRSSCSRDISLHSLAKGSISLLITVVRSIWVPKSRYLQT